MTFKVSSVKILVVFFFLEELPSYFVPGNDMINVPPRMTVSGNHKELSSS